jgi:hypothetical protein
MPTTITSGTIDATAIDRDFVRADIEFEGLDHAGPSYEGRVYLNKPDANEMTEPNIPEYAGSYFIFGHGRCLGDVGHCEAVPRRPFDPRQAHPLTPARKIVIATHAIRQALQSTDQLTVTVVPVILSTSPFVGRPDDLVKYERVRVTTYRVTDPQLPQATPSHRSRPDP